MTVHGLSNPAEPLLAFGEALGIASDVWAKREELEQITYTDPEYSREKATSITLEQIAPLIAAYPDALTCRFRLDDLTVLDIVPDVDEASLEKFRDDIQSSPTVVFEFRLDKTRLVERWTGGMSDYRPFLYLFPEALESFLTSDLSRLESLLWGSERETHKVVLLVPDREIRLNGAYLAVLGGKQIGHWHEVVSQPSRDADELRNMYETCQKNLNWQVPWLKHLTPLHLKVNGQIPREDPIAKALLIHQVNSIILYTADRTVGDNDKPRLSTYAGASQSVELTLGNPADPIEEKVLAGVSDLMEMLEWAYNPKWSADRLPLVQIGIAQTLHAASPAVRYQLLLHNAPNIFDGLKWHWKVFIEGKVDAYVSQVHALEDYVADTIQAFADQIAAMIKSLSDTMLAAVAVLLGSFIAALFKDEFNPTIFTIGMVVYAVYVLIFPLFYNMRHQWERYQALLDNFKERQLRFEERLYPEKVGTIVGTQVTGSQRRFTYWFWATCAAYIVVIILAIVAALWMPGFMESIALSAVSPPAP